MVQSLKQLCITPTTLKDLVLWGAPAMIGKEAAVVYTLGAIIHTMTGNKREGD